MASPQFDPNWSRLPSGTEISELRTSTSHTYSNGDGTFTADITPMGTGGADSQDSCQPTSTGYIYRAWVSPHEIGYFRSGPGLHYDRNVTGTWAVAYAEFDLALIPYGSLVRAAQFRRYQYEVAGSPVRTRCIHANLDPDSSSDTTVYQGVMNGSVLAESVFSDVGWGGHELNQLGVTILQGRLALGWITLGIKPVSGSATSYGITDDSLQAYLRVVYNAPGTGEPSGTTLRRPELDIAPNPTVGRFITIQSCIASERRKALALRDVLGRTVRSFSLDPCGCTRLDLRDLPPGVYMATLEAGTQSLTRKLVLTAR